MVRKKKLQNLTPKKINPLPKVEPQNKPSPPLFVVIEPQNKPPPPPFIVKEKANLS